MVRGLQASGAAVDTQLASGAIRVFGHGHALTNGEAAPNEAAESSGARASACRSCVAKWLGHAVPHASSRAVRISSARLQGENLNNMQDAALQHNAGARACHDAVPALHSLLR